MKSSARAFIDSNVASILYLHRSLTDDDHAASASAHLLCIPWPYYDRTWVRNLPVKGEVDMMGVRFDDPKPVSFEAGELSEWKAANLSRTTAPPLLKSGTKTAPTASPWRRLLR